MASNEIVGFESNLPVGFFPVAEVFLKLGMEDGRPFEPAGCVPHAFSPSPSSLLKDSTVSGFKPCVRARSTAVRSRFPFLGERIGGRFPAPRKARTRIWSPR